MKEDDSPHRSWLEKLGSVLAGEPRDRETLMETLREAQRNGLLEAEAVEMIEGVLEVSETQVRDVMIPRGQMVVLHQDWALERVLEVALGSGHSRFPVIGDDRDEVLGIVIVKDILRHFAAGRNGADFALAEYLRPAQFIPESKRLNALLKEFRDTHLHMAIVVDEYGGVAGLVTIEDVLEEIVGEIDDEHDVDDEGEDIRKLGERDYTVRALTTVEDFNEYFGADFDEDEADTVGGLVISACQHLPKRGETVELGRFRFRVLRADNRRVDLFGLSVIDDTPVAEEPNDAA